MTNDARAACFINAVLPPAARATARGRQIDRRRRQSQKCTLLVTHKQGIYIPRRGRRSVRLARPGSAVSLSGAAARFDGSTSTAASPAREMHSSRARKSFDTPGRLPGCPSPCRSGRPSASARPLDVVVGHIGRRASTMSVAVDVAEADKAPELRVAARRDDGVLAPDETVMSCQSSVYAWCPRPSP